MPTGPEIPVAETEVIPPNGSPRRGLGDAGTAYPLDRMPAGCVMVRREVVWAIGGAVIGAALTIWLLNNLKKH